MEVIYPSHEENITWYDSLTEDKKIECFKEAVYKMELFGEYLRQQNISVLDANFATTTWFNMLMQLVGRAR